MTFFLQLVVTGLAQGMVYALIAIGFVIILKCSEVFNIAQGHFVLIGGYLGYTFLVTFGLPVWASEAVLGSSIPAVTGLGAASLGGSPAMAGPPNSRRSCVKERTCSAKMIPSDAESHFRRNRR